MRMGLQLSETPGNGWDGFEYDLGQAFQSIATKHGWLVTIGRVSNPAEYDLVGFIGVRNYNLAKKCVEANVPFIYFDKAYNRNRRWWKLVYGSHQPTCFLGDLKMPSDRRNREAWKIKSWRPSTSTGHVLIAGSSEKYHIFHDLPHPNEYWAGVIEKIKTITNRPILYRPKKSWHSAKPLPGSEFSQHWGIMDDLRGAHVMVTYGSNAVMESLEMGVPTICLGDAITRKISSTTLAAIENPRLATREELDQMYNDLAYFQWSIDEIRMGRFWPTLEKCISLSKGGV